MLTGAAVKKFQRKLGFEQEIMFNFADIITESYVAESLLLRIKKMETVKGGNLDLYKDILDAYIFDSANVVYKNGLEAIYSFIDEANTDKYINALKYYTAVKPVNVKDGRRRIAEKIIDDNKYMF